MKTIGLTGGIGSGKTTVCKIFEWFGTPVFHADEVGKSLMSHDQEIKDEICNLFGTNAYLDGQPNRKFIAAQVFNDKSKLHALNAIIHPAVRQAAHLWSDQYAHLPYGIREVAILFESGLWRDVDHIVTVHAHRDLRIERVILRDGSTKKEVMDRMQNQLSDGLRLALSEFVILNDRKSIAYTTNQTTTRVIQ